MLNMAAASDVQGAWIALAGSVIVAIIGFLGVWVTVTSRRLDSKVDSAVDAVFDRLANVERRLTECEEREQARHAATGG